MSDLKTLLVHLDDSAEMLPRLRAAQSLAAAQGAEVEVLHAVMSMMAQHPFSFTADADILSQLLVCETEAHRKARTKFEQDRLRAGLEHVAWRDADDEPVRAFVREAFAADLLLLAQPDPRAAVPSAVPPGFIASVLIESGKPALVLPYVDSGSSFGSNALVAWKAGPESARALAAALPLLRRARQVHLVTWQETDGPTTAAALPVQRYLERHGIAVTLHHEGRVPGDLGDILLSYCADLAADLLVMGCYGHGRAREWALGGVTRTVLASMTLPVLMSH